MAFIVCVASMMMVSKFNLFAALNDQRNFPPTGPTPAIDEKKTVLLSAMASDLALIQDFRPDDFMRVYLPQNLVAEMQVRDMQRRAVLNTLSPTPSASPPVPALFPPPPPKPESGET
jgi:hypothetical protein